MIHTKHLRRGPFKSHRELLQKNSKVTIGQICTQGLLHWRRWRPLLGSSEPQGNIFSHTHRRATCIFSCQSSEACGGTITSGGQNGRRRWQKWHAEKEYVWHGTQQAVASVIGNSMSKAGVCNLGSARRICFARKGTKF